MGRSSRSPKPLVMWRRGRLNQSCGRWRLSSLDRGCAPMAIASLMCPICGGGGYAHYPHIALAEALRVIIWDRTNIVNRIGIFGYPGVMGATFELLTALPRPCRKMRICGFGKESAPCSPRGRPLRTATVRSTFAR